MSNTFKGFAAGIIAAIFYGTNPLGTLFLYQDEINPTSVLVWRYAIASLLFLAWMIAKRESFHGSPDKPGGLSIQLCKSEKKEFYIRYSS